MGGKGTTITQMPAQVPEPTPEERALEQQALNYAQYIQPSAFYLANTAMNQLGMYGNNNIPYVNYNDIYGQMNSDANRLRYMTDNLENQTNTNLNNLNNINQQGYNDVNNTVNDQLNNINNQLNQYNTTTNQVQNTDKSLMNTILNLGNSASNIANNTNSDVLKYENLLQSLGNNNRGIQDLLMNDYTSSYPYVDQLNNVAKSQETIANSLNNDQNSQQLQDYANKQYNLAQQTQQAINNYNDLYNKTGDLTQNNSNLANQYINKFALAENGELPQQLLDSQRKYIEQGALNDFTNYLNQAAAHGVVNSSVTDNALKNINQNIANALNQAYNQTYFNYNNMLGSNLAAQQAGYNNAINSIGNQANILGQYMQGANTAADIYSKGASNIATNANLGLQKANTQSGIYGQQANTLGAAQNSINQRAGLLNQSQQLNNDLANYITNGANLAQQRGQNMFNALNTNLGATQNASNINQNIANLANNQLQSNSTIADQNITTRNNLWNQGLTNFSNLLNTMQTANTNAMNARSQAMTNNLQNAGLIQQTAAQTPISLFAAATGQNQPTTDMWKTMSNQRYSVATPAQTYAVDNGPGLFGSLFGGWASSGFKGLLK